MKSQVKSFERVNQKLRTRAELLRAAGELAGKGLQPSVAEVADYAGISRATAYRYFSKPEDMMREATLDAIARVVQPRVQSLEEGLKGGEDAVSHLVKQVFDMVLQNEATFRSFLASAVTGKDVKRGGRRLVWLAEVLAPLRDRLPQKDYDRLRYSLSLLTGIETLIVLKDVCGLDDKRAEDVTLWAAKTLLAGVSGGSREAK